MKSVHDMTGAEIESARKSGATVYGTVLYRPSYVIRGERVYADIEDFCPFALRKTVADMLTKGWREMPDNRYRRAGVHYAEVCKRLDANLSAMAFGGEWK